MAFLNKIVDLFGKIVDLLFERGVLPHLENPPGYGPDMIDFNRPGQARVWP